MIYKVLKPTPPQKISRHSKNFFATCVAQQREEFARSGSSWRSYSWSGVFGGCDKPSCLSNKVIVLPQEVAHEQGLCQPKMQASGDNGVCQLAEREFILLFCE